MNGLRWKVQYRNNLTVAAFAWWDDAERYINAEENALVKDRLTVKEIEDE